MNGPKLDEGQSSPDGVGMRFTNTGLAGPRAGHQEPRSWRVRHRRTVARRRTRSSTSRTRSSRSTSTGNAYEAGHRWRRPQRVEHRYGRRDAHRDQRPLRRRRHASHRRTADRRRTAASSSRSRTPRSTPSSISRPAAIRASSTSTSSARPAVTTGTVNYEFISGICDGDIFLIGDLVNAGRRARRSSPSSVPASRRSSVIPTAPARPTLPIADAIETALAEISIAGSVGEAVKVNLDAPVHVRSTKAPTRLTSGPTPTSSPSIGTGPTDCQPPAGAPDLASTFDVPGAFPTLGATTPVG